MSAGRFLLLAAVLSLLLLPFAAPVQAEDYRTVDDSSPQEVVDGMANKLVRGVANFATGWWELPKQIRTTIKEEGVGKGLTVGPIKGIGMALVRTAAGIGETFTFLLPYPGFYSPYMDPPYVWEKE